MADIPLGEREKTAGEREGERERESEKAAVVEIVRFLVSHERTHS